MGDRISISFANGKDESVALFSHWGGMSFLEKARQYVVELKKTLEKRDSGIVNPIDRLEPDTVMVDFIRHITKGKELIESDLYLGKDENCGDNSDNGHYKIELDIREEPTLAEIKDCKNCKFSPCPKHE
jgi:hypothetical protein